MKRIYACFAIVAALLATAFYSSFQVQRFADDISTDLDCAIEAIRNSDLPTARQALARGADRCDRMREKMNHLLRTEDFTELEAALRTADGNANVRFHQQDTLERIYSNLESENIHIKRSRMDCGSCSREIVETVEKHSELFYIRANRCGSLYDSLLALRGWQREEINGIGYELNSIIVEKWEGKAYRLVIQRERRLDGEQDLWEGEYTYRCILTNDYTSTNREIVEFYNLRGGKERIFDDMNNGFGWARLPKSFMAENTVFLLLTAIIRNFYKFLMGRLGPKAFGLKKCSRIKAFVFKFVSVPAKWIRTARHYELNIYTDNQSYLNPFALADG